MKPTYKPDFSSILDVIDANPYLNMLFQEFSQEKSLLSELLFVHRNQLFPTLDERIQFQYIFWDNLEGSSSPETSVIAVEEKMARAKQFPKDMEMSLEDLVYNIRDLVLYFAVRFFRENEELMELANSESFDFTKMKETLKDFSSIRSTFEQIIQEISNVESCEEEIKKS